VLCTDTPFYKAPNFGEVLHYEPQKGCSSFCGVSSERAGISLSSNMLLCSGCTPAALQWGRNSRSRTSVTTTANQFVKISWFATITVLGFMWPSNEHPSLRYWRIFFYEWHFDRFWETDSGVSSPAVSLLVFDVSNSDWLSKARNCIHYLQLRGRCFISSLKSPKAKIFAKSQKWHQNTRTQHR